ncbi:hypothetical protein HYW18_02180 [Candidatus Uhrbacteria bacterium]|nr:hypothetical protein [Candidatus Uhrbacteria bacterium]
MPAVKLYCPLFYTPGLLMEAIVKAMIGTPDFGAHADNIRPIPIVTEGRSIYVEIVYKEKGTRTPDVCNDLHTRVHMALTECLANTVLPVEELKDRERPLVALIPLPATAFSTGKPAAVA